MANYLRGLSAGIILLVAIAAAATIYLQQLSELRAAEEQVLSERAEDVQRYIETLSREMRQFEGRIEGNYSSASGERLAEPHLRRLTGIKPDAIDNAGPGLRRELDAITNSGWFTYLSYNDSTLARVYYRSQRDFVYAVPPVAHMSDLAESVDRSGSGPDWRFRRGRIFGTDEELPVLTVEIPVNFAGQFRGVLGAQTENIRPLLSNGEAVGRSYLLDASTSLNAAGQIVFAGRTAPARGGDSAEASAGAAIYWETKHWETKLPGGLRLVHRFPPGEPYWAAARASAFPLSLTFLAAGLISFTVHRALRSEIVERRRAQQDLRDAYDRERRLTSRLRRLASELTTVQHREQKRIAALLHDELQQLLVGAQMSLAQDRPDKAAELIANAIGASRDLTQQLRPPALYEAGLVPALRTLAEQMQRRHALRVDVDAGDPEISPDLTDDVKALVFEAVRELIFNAVKHAGVDRVAVKLRTSSARLRISVEDQGRGFEVGSTEDEQSATSFGLFSVRERLRELDGDMSVQSSLGHGTAIRLSIPLSADRSSPPNSDAPQDPACPSGCPGSSADVLRIVIADDHTTVRETLANVLDSDSQLKVVDQACDGPEAIETVQRERPDVALVDLNMPGMSGIDAISHICDRCPDVAVFGLSVEDGTAASEAIRNAGGIGLLVKSMDPDAMVTEITGFTAARAGSAP